jgi:hypothetical protein
MEAIEKAELEHELVLGRNLRRVDVFHIDGSIACTVLVKPPHPAVWRRFKNAVQGDVKPAKKDEALHALYRPCLVWPDAETVTALGDKYPRLADMVADACGELAGAKEEETRKK